MLSEVNDISFILDLVRHNRKNLQQDCKGK